MKGMNGLTLGPEASAGYELDDLGNGTTHGGSFGRKLANLRDKVLRPPGEVASFAKINVTR